MDDACKDIHQMEEDDEEAQIDDEEESDEEEVEPDFMDNSGKCWEFGSKIVDEKHLKEWCQNKMGGMIVGKEEKLTRQFHCQIKQCQFKAIFLKTCSIVYTRNQHNHVVESAEHQQDYVDHFGRAWTFRANIGKNVPNGIWLSKFGFSIRNRQQTFYLFCQRRMANGGKCPIKGIYVKENGCLYIRGKHEHKRK